MAYSKLLPLSSSTKAPTQVFCSRLNVSVCNTTVENDSFTVTLYNPIGRAVDYYVSVPTGSLHHDVYDSTLKKVNCSVSARVSLSALVSYVVHVSTSCIELLYAHSLAACKN